MKKILTLTVVLLLTLLGRNTDVIAATAVDIPAATTINWENATLENCKSENGGTDVGSTGENTVITFSINNTVKQGYILSFLTGTKNEADLNVTLTDGDVTYLDETIIVLNTGNWTPSVKHQLVIPELPVGEYSLVFKVTRTTDKYAGNYGSLTFSSTSDYDKCPGTLSLAKGTYNGPRTENDNDNVGFVTNGGTATYSFINTEAGVYNMTLDFYGLNAGKMNIIVTDENTGTEEVNTIYEITKNAGYTPTTILLPGKMETGVKKITFTFTNEGGGFICNYKAPRLEKYASNIAMVKNVSIDGLSVKEGTTTDWLVNIPTTYDETTTFRVESISADLTVTARDAEGTDVPVTDNGDGTYSISTPAANTTTIVSLKVAAQEDAAVNKEEWTLALFRIGEIQMTALAIDGMTVELPADINTAPYTATVSGRIATSMPEVEATFLDGSTATGTGTLSGTTATYTIEGKIGEDTRTFTIAVEGVQIYEMTDKDEIVELKYTSEGKEGDGNWSNGIYTLESTSLDGWSNSSFKFNATENTWKIPSDVVVKQVIFKDFNANYNSGRLVSLVSEGATVTIPTKHSYDEPDETKYDLVINLDGHKAGTPFTFTLEGGGQPVAWFQLVIEKVSIVSSPVLENQSVTSTEHKNHCVVALTYDREMTTTTATIGDRTVTAEGGSATLYFPVWDLEYNKDYTLTIAAGAAQDTYGNSNAEAINIPIKVGSKAVVEKAVYDYVVSDVEEFKAAFAAVNNSNTSADAARKTIFIKNGDYDFGSEEQRLTAYNVSLIGESRDGVMLHGNRDGISNPVLNLRDRTGFYLQDLTVRNDNNFGKEEKGGVAVAIYGGDKTAMKNVRMLSNQDTQVTGNRAYFENCEIHGTVDFICGGGDNFYSHTDLVLEDRGGNCITAPSTSSTLKWGYVFQNCTIRAAEEASSVTNGSYNLGRPWQDTPRANFLNTIMYVLPSDGAWAGMSDGLTTHFYEYNSMNPDSTKVDLSKRTNSPSSANKYTPVLTDKEAKAYTLENVLGGTDSWLPTEETVTVAAPVVTVKDKTLSWEDSDDARCYVIFCDGEYVTNQTETTFTITTDGKYTIRAANVNGGLGEVSNVVDTSVSGITTVEADKNEEYIIYNLNGQRVNTMQKGQVYIVNGKKVIYQ